VSGRGRFFSEFVGCKVSQADSEAARQELFAAGWLPVGSVADAELVVVHTCCVTAEAERKSRRLVNRRARGGARVVVAGCAATRDAAQFAAEGVTVMGEEGWASLAGSRAGAGEQGWASTADPAVGGGEGGAVVPVGGAGGRTRRVLKVQDGCAGRCTYCAVRLVRGAPRSLPLAAAVAAARRALDGGCGELVLSGIDLGSYRSRDHAGVSRLADLVVALVELPGLARLRLSSLEPLSIDEPLLEALAHPRVARHLHVPLQSADDGVLAAMGRPYRFGQYLERLDRVKAALGDCLVSTDLMVGFPAEDEDAFARSLRALEGGLFGRVHVFAFSPRPGTAAEALGTLPVSVVKERRAAAAGAAARAASAAAEAALGRSAEVLVEEHRGAFWRGYSSQYVRYYLEGDARPGRLVRAVATVLHDDGVRGRVADDGAAGPRPAP
jgi:threonylcarbamoyladenosine tRNA methylthiotransferase MtaB